MANKKRTPLGKQHVDMTLSRELMTLLYDIKKESGEPISQCIEEWMWQHPLVKTRVEQQEKGRNQHE